MDVTNAEQARIAEQSGACAVMALERIPADIRKEGTSMATAIVGQLKPFLRRCVENV